MKVSLLNKKLRKLSAACFVIFFVVGFTNLLILEQSIHMKNPFLVSHIWQRRILADRLRHYEHYQQIELNRTGPGEMGMPVNLTKSEQQIVDKEVEKEGMSPFLNSKVSLDRSLPDYRPERCKAVQYPKDLPTMSVVIIFCNELYRVVLRTVHSVINRTPPRYLHEVILVDDASIKPELGTTLDNYTSKMWPGGFVKVIHLKERHGLIRTRLAGVHAATGDVIVVMDGHMEVNHGWAEPLLARIKMNNRTLVVPTIDAIDWATLKYINMSMSAYQSFKWDLQFLWLEHPDREKHDPTIPIETTGIVGCVFAMHRQTFLDMGSFDKGMNYWGAENTELPIRVWMCGGRVEVVPCSRIAHTYRLSTRPWNSSNEDYFGRNSQRVAEVWLDEYKEQFYLMKPDRLEKDYGNITSRIELRKRLKCKSFKWFLENIVQPPKHYWSVNVTAWGMVRNGAGAMCLDALTFADWGPVGIYPCYSPRGVNQLFSLTWDKEIRRDMSCLEYPLTSDPGQNLTMTNECLNKENNRVWIYEPNTAKIIHTKTGFCMDAAGYKLTDRTYATLNPCSDVESQKWVWENYKGPPKPQ